MLRFLADKSLTIIFHKNRKFIFLMQTIIFDIIAMRCNKLAGAIDCWNKFIDTHNFRLCGKFCIEILFGGANNGKSTSQRQASSRVSLHIMMYHKRCIHPPFQNSTSVGTED